MRTIISKKCHKIIKSFGSPLEATETSIRERGEDKSNDEAAKTLHNELKFNKRTELCFFHFYQFRKIFN